MLFRVKFEKIVEYTVIADSEEEVRKAAKNFDESYLDDDADWDRYVYLESHKNKEDFDVDMGVLNGKLVSIDAYKEAKE